MLVMTRIIVTMSLLIWAGASISANMIAAPAKFQVAALTRPVALQVGRMQFQWVGYFEMALALTALLAFTTQSRSLQILVCAAVAVFVIQRFVVLPQLSNITDQVVSGTARSGSHMHLVYIGLELTKILFLLAAGAVALLTPTFLTPQV